MLSIEELPYGWQRLLQVDLMKRGKRRVRRIVVYKLINPASDMLCRIDGLCSAPG